MNDALGGVQTVLVLGGTSELAQATLAALDLRPGAKVALAGRDAAALAAVNVPTSGGGSAEVIPLVWDAANASGGPEVIEAAVKKFGGDRDSDERSEFERGSPTKKFGGDRDSDERSEFERGSPTKKFGDIDLVLVAAGILGDQARAEADVAHAVDILSINLVGVAAAMLPAAERLRAQGHGVIVVFSSVAGLRGRRANFVYGASKAGLDALAEGLQASLAGSGARLLVVRPGFVRTKMTAHMKDAPFATTPDVVGAAVADAIRKGREVVHVPRLLGPVFAGFRLLPRPVFRKLPG